MLSSLFKLLTLIFFLFLYAEGKLKLYVFKERTSLASGLSNFNSIFVSFKPLLLNITVAVLLELTGTKPKLTNGSKTTIAFFLNAFKSRSILKFLSLAISTESK